MEDSVANAFDFSGNDAFLISRETQNTSDKWDKLSRERQYSVLFLDTMSSENHDAS